MNPMEEFKLLIDIIFVYHISYKLLYVVYLIELAFNKKHIFTLLSHLNPERGLFPLLPFDLTSSNSIVTLHQLAALGETL
jgi:hypothetical protein